MKHTYVRLISNLLWRLEHLFYLPKLKRVLETIHPENSKHLIFDIGANRGQSLDFFSGLYPGATFYCFEPLPDIYRE